MSDDATNTVTGDHPVLLFDGVCNLCNGVVQRIIPRDPEGRIRFAPLQSETGKALLAGHGLPPGDLDSAVLVERYRFYTEAPDGTVRYTDVSHDTWTLYPARADIETATIAKSSGFDRPSGEPVYYYSPGLDVTASPSKRGEAER